MPRTSLRDRNKAAIEKPIIPDASVGNSAAPPIAPVADELERKAEQSAPVRPQPKAKKSAPKKAAATDVGRIGVYLTQEEFDESRGAYLADWSNGGDSDSFGRWVAAAIERHAALTPQQRAQRGGLRERADERSGSPRSFSIPSATLQRMRAAITADQRAGRWPTDSAWCGEAIRVATNEARTANGGVLPTPPARLPNRLVR